MHRFYTTVLLAIRNLSLHKLRVLLTILGLIFGVGSVIAMLAIAEGASLEAQRQIASLGATNIIVRSQKPQSDENPSKQQNTESFVFSFGVTYDDYRTDSGDDSHGDGCDSAAGIRQEGAAPRA